MLEKYLKIFDQARLQPLLLEGAQNGLEKENLRITANGRIAQTMHPTALGAAFTHPFITTDYSESLLEIITPPANGAAALLSWLDNLHIYVYQHLQDELLWTPSMPCAIASPDEIPIAQYGSSHEGYLSTLYRVGLGHRYEKKMQTIAGIHFNYSLPTAFWEIWHEHFALKQQTLQTTIDTAYFGLIRNFLRYGWLIDYLFGASSACASSFVSGAPPATFKTYHDHTLYGPDACSFRMSDLGYHNKTQKELHISVNSLEEYLSGLTRAINTPYPPYQAIFEQYGQHAQINANLLQIEAEYYAPVRPKRVAHDNERQGSALKRAGVEYLEVRTIDINPYEPLGITARQIYFLEVFLLYCLFQDSPLFTPENQKLTNANMQKVVLNGRNPKCELIHPLNKQPILLTAFAENIFSELIKVADFLDVSTDDGRYQDAVNYFAARVKDSSLLPSAQMQHDLLNHYDSFQELGLALSQKQKDYFLQKKLSPLPAAELQQLAIESLQEQAVIESQQTGTFAEYLAKYFQ